MGDAEATTTGSQVWENVPRRAMRQCAVRSCVLCTASTGSRPAKMDARYSPAAPHVSNYIELIRMALNFPKCH